MYLINLFNYFTILWWSFGFFSLIFCFLLLALLLINLHSFITFYFFLELDTFFCTYVGILNTYKL